MEEVNRQTGANVDPNADPGDMLQSNTRGLMAAMSTLPELTERKRTIDKHTTLLGSIVKASRVSLLQLSSELVDKGSSSHTHMPRNTLCKRWPGL